jgi:hypothetical protein
MKEAPFGVLFFARIFCLIPAPTLDLRQTPISRLPKPPLWEQSLLAMTAAHPTLMQADPLLSRASFAPTGFALENLQIIGGMSKIRHKKAPFGVLFCAPIYAPSSSHTGSAADSDFPATQTSSVGAKLARDDSGTSNIDAS